MQILVITLLAIFSFLFAKPSVVYAHCPLCVAGAGVGLTLSRILGIDDSITGVWIGAFLGATTFWFQRILGQKKKIFLTRWMGIILYLLIFGTSLWSFYKFNLIVRHGDIFGWDKLTFGMVLGAVVFYLVDIANIFLKKKDGKRLFPYQGVILSLGSIVITSAVVYILINYYI